MPTNVNYQANIWALKNEGCTHIIAATACGSLKEDIQPGDIVIIDQFIDRYCYFLLCLKCRCRSLTVEPIVDFTYWVVMNDEF